ncbi:hypothetical protein SLS55_009229 [Diplodia seriata]|uniref:Uncharacterized protein n=1 Tax=Diplodia seriata TaxID=420778 RepID=A0ABR3C4L6_9PEZI
MGFWPGLPWNNEIRRLRQMHDEAQRSNKALQHSNRALAADLEETMDNLRRSERSEATLRKMKIHRVLTTFPAVKDELSEKVTLLAQAEVELAVGPLATRDDGQAVS